MLKSAIAALLIATGLPFAADAQTSSSVRVAYRDLNLSSAQGMATLDRRIKHAVRLVCPDDGDINLRRRIDVAQCRRAARVGVAAQRRQALAAITPSTTIAGAR